MIISLMFSKVPNVVLNDSGHNHNNSLSFVPQKLYSVDKNTKKKYKRKEHSYLKIAKLIELSGWAKRKVAFESLFSEQMLTCLRRN